MIDEDKNITTPQSEEVKADAGAPVSTPDTAQPREWHRKPRPQRKPGPRAPEEGASEFIEKVVAISRVSKVTKGGKKISFSALVVVGDGHGKVGYNLGKANEVASAIRKALVTAKKDMVAVPLKGTTIPHEIHGACGGAVVMLKPACDGTGIIAAGPVRAVCEAAGINNILTKCHRSNNPINVVKATMNGLLELKPAPQQAPANVPA